MSNLLKRDIAPDPRAHCYVCGAMSYRRVIARDAAGHDTTSTISVAVLNDTTAPTVAVTSPTTGTHANLLAQVSGAMKAFYDATVQLGVASQVTTFTLSDFSRTWVPNGTLGTDHAWGSHQFVMGGSVLGREFYGMPGSNGTVFPTLAANGPDDTDSGTNARGRWIPTVAIDQYGATLASWIGVANADLAAVFPNIGRFGQSNLGFLA